MEYIDNCPNCDLQLTVVENPGNVAILFNKKAVGSHCPKCKCHLGVDRDGLYLIENSQESDLEQDED